MGYELTAYMSKGPETEEFEVAISRSAIDHVLGAIGRKHPRAITSEESLPWPSASLSDDEAAALLEDWLADLDALGDDDIDEADARFGAQIEPDFRYPLKSRLAAMRDLARQGYAVRFQPE